MKLRSLLAGTALAAAALVATGAQAAFPGYGADATPTSPADGPGWLITIDSSNVATLSQVAGQSVTYDGGCFSCGDDTYIGVINNSSGSVGSLTLKANTSADAFGFDGDGIDYYGAPGNAMDNTGYGGPNAYFTNLMFNQGGFDIGTVNFITPIASGGSSYFSLEGQINLSSFSGGGGITPGGGGVPEPATWAMMLVGFAGIGYGLRRRAAKAAVA